MKSLQGQLLVASPHLEDPNFVRTVVLLIQHSEEGAFGVVLNRALSKTVQELWADVGEEPCDNTHPLYLGGPVEGPLLALHAREEWGEVEILPGVYFSAQKDHLEKLVAENDDQCLLFVGYSGWGGGQLEGELEQGAWFTTPAKAEYVFHPDAAELWKAVSREIGHTMLHDMLQIKHVPDDPSLN